MKNRWLPTFSLLLLGTALAFASDPQQATSQSNTEKRSNWPRVRVRGLTVSAGYSHMSGYPYWGYPYGSYWGYPYAFGPVGAWSGLYYDPFFWGFPVHPGLYSGFGARADRGEVKLRAAEKSASVYIDGGYAGEVGALKSMWLDPGAYDLEIRPTQGAPYQQRIYVLTGKTLKIDPSRNAEESRQ